MNQNIKTNSIWVGVLFTVSVLLSGRSTFLGLHPSYPVVAWIIVGVLCLLTTAIWIVLMRPQTTQEGGGGQWKDKWHWKQKFQWADGERTKLEAELAALKAKMLPSSYSTPQELRVGVVSLLGGLYALLLDNGDDPCHLREYVEAGLDSRNPEDAYTKETFIHRFRDQLSAIVDGAHKNGFWDIISFKFRGVKERSLRLDSDVCNGDDVRSRIDTLKELLQAIDDKYPK